MEAFARMRITMICIGSTGDVRPYIVLGRELKARGHEITICAFSDFEHAVLKEGLHFKPINGNVKNIVEYFKGYTIQQMSVSVKTNGALRS